MMLYSQKSEMEGEKEGRGGTSPDFPCEPTSAVALFGSPRLQLY